MICGYQIPFLLKTGLGTIVRSILAFAILLKLCNLETNIIQVAPEIFFLFWQIHGNHQTLHGRGNEESLCKSYAENETTCALKLLLSFFQ